MGEISSTNTRKITLCGKILCIIIYNIIYNIAVVGQLRVPARNSYAHTGNFARLHPFFVGFSYANIAFSYRKTHNPAPDGAQYQKFGM